MNFLREWCLRFKAPPSLSIRLLFLRFCEFFGIVLNPWTIPTICRNNKRQTYTISLGFQGFLSTSVNCMELQLNKPCKKKKLITSKLKLTSSQSSNFFNVYRHSNIWNMFQKKRWWWHFNLMLKQWQNTYHHL